jgi:hypothetical protein
MFLVRCVHPIGDGWEDRDAAAEAVAGRKWDVALTERGRRELGWMVRDFREATDLIVMIRTVPGVRAGLSET